MQPYISEKLPMVKTLDKELAETPDYKTVQRVILDLYYGGIIQKGGGYCISMSDMIRTLLLQNGIDASLLECKLTIIKTNPPGLSLIGHHGLRKSNDFSDIDTHIVCVTNTTIPMLIDLSIHDFQPGIPFICERINGVNIKDETDQSSDVISKYEFGNNSTWIYQTREVQRIPRQHQIGIIDRFKTDARVFDDIKWLKILSYLGVAFAVVNFVINVTILNIT